jgi:hypothetical protein
MRQARPKRVTRRNAGAIPRRTRQRSTAVSQYVQLGAFFITVPNLIVICAMIVVFVAGLILRLPGHKQD